MADPTVVWPDLDWETASPEDMGASTAALGAAGRMLARPGSNASALVVIRHGRLIWEQYYYGFDHEDRHHLFSVTKSFLSSLIGIALAEGALESIEQPVLDFFPESSGSPASAISQVTLRHLLTMTTGLMWPRIGWGREPMVERMRHSPDWTQFILGVPVQREKIGLFHYCSAASHLLSAILTRATGMSACEYARTRLFAPLGIQEVKPGTDWEADPSNVTLGGWGLHLTAREVARFGWLYVCGGRWKGQGLLEESWVRESTQAQNGNPAGYGYQWWLRQIGQDQVFAGLGYGGQYLLCIPARQMVAVILSRPINRWPDRWDVLKTLLVGLECKKQDTILHC